MRKRYLENNLVLGISFMIFSLIALIYSFSQSFFYEIFNTELNIFALGIFTLIGGLIAIISFWLIQKNG